MALPRLHPIPFYILSDPHIALILGKLWVACLYHLNNKKVSWVGFEKTTWLEKIDPARF